MSQPKSRLGFFNDKLTEFFRDLAYAFPEERDLQKASEYIEMAKRSNPRLILDMFYEHVYVGAHEMVEKDDEDAAADHCLGAGIAHFKRSAFDNISVQS